MRTPHVERGAFIDCNKLVLCAVLATVFSRAEAAPDAEFVAVADAIPLADAALAQPPPPPVTPQTSGTADSNLSADRILWHIPDPEGEIAAFDAAYERARQANDRAAMSYFRRVHDRVNEIRRPVQRRMALQEAIRIALEHNFAIQVASYNPAVETTRVVEAEAAFDGVFFTNITKNNIDRPTGSQLQATDADIFTSSYGVRKLLPSGMSVSGSYQLNRTKTSLQFQGVNPEYTSNFVYDMRQPLLRGFGIDFNRSLIVLSKNDRRISQHAFERQVRDTLRLVEEYYWRLVQARRDVVVTARVLADFEAINEYLVARQQFDITPVQIAATRANLEQSKADFVRRRANVFDAEDRLVAVMNAEGLDLADDIEIIPNDIPPLRRIMVDRLAEVQTALDHRPEIKEQELRISNAKILIDRSKNGELPQFDLTFRATADGLAQSADRSFDELTRFKFIEYFVGVEISAPIGNRGRIAATHRSRLQHSQAIAVLKRTLEEVILDVNLATRAMGTAYDQIGSAFEAAEAREREVDSIVARAERKDINTLSTELNARQSLAAARRGLIGTMVEYNIAIADLERAKGTLLLYNNVVIPVETDCVDCP